MPRKIPPSAAPRLRACGLGVLLSTTAMLSPASADDTEVFFGQVGQGINAYPNVLFVLDTSGSMNYTDAGQSGTRLQRMKTAMKEILNNTPNINVGLMRFNGAWGGGSVLYPVTPIDEEVCQVGDCGYTSLSTRIADPYDDVEERLSNGNVMPDGVILSMGQDGGNRDQAVGIRFTELSIPRGANIVSAKLEFVAKESNNSASILTIKAEKIGDSPRFTDDQENVSDRDTTDAEATWYPGAWTADSTYESGDISDVVQEVVNQDGWCGGQALSFIITGSGERAGKTFNESPEESARLSLTYDPADIADGGGCMTKSTVAQVNHRWDDAEQNLKNNSVALESADLKMPRTSKREQMVGVRFDSLDLPKGARITAADIEFIVDRYRDGDVRLSIKGESSGNAQRYSGARDELRSRPKTAQSVTWGSIPAAGVNASVRTPDLTNIVQAIVDRGDWEAENAMAFYLERSGGAANKWREFESFDGERASAPKLRVTYEVDEIGATDTVLAKQKMIEIIDGLSATGGTPIVDAYYEAAQYYLGGSVDYGKTRGTVTPYGSYMYDGRDGRHRVSHPDSYTGGSLFTPSSCDPANPDHWNCRYQAIQGNARYISPLEASCQTSNIVFLSDGAATSNSAEDRVRALTGKSCAGSGSQNENCGVELAQWLNETDHNADVAKQQGISTYTIAFNLDDPEFLRNLASSGGGDFYEAESASQLAERFRDILNDVKSVDTSFTAPGATVNQFNRLTHREDIYFALFKPDRKPNWDGNLKRYRVGLDNNDEGDEDIRGRDGEPAVDEESGFFSSTAKSYWPERDDSGSEVTTPDGEVVARGGAAHQLSLTGPNGTGDRRLFTWISDEDVPTTGIVLDQTNNELHEDNDDITDALLGIENIMSDPDDQKAYRETLLKWTRGVDVFDIDGDDNFDEVRPQMGDPMHTRPAIVNYKIGDDDKSVVYLATNQGYLHAIDTDNGAERWSFVPDELLSNFNDFFLNSATTKHPYGLDGPMTVWRIDPDENFIIDKGKGEEVFIFIGMRRGGNNYYAFNVTDPNNPKLAWEIKGGEGDFKELGQSWSSLSPARIIFKGEKKDVLIFGAGYSTNQDPKPDTANGGVLLSQTMDTVGRGIYIVDARTGELLWSALGSTDGKQFFADLDYSIPGDIRIADTDLDGYADQLYAADTGGHVWRFDFKSHHQAGDGNLLDGGIIADLAGIGDGEQRRFYNVPDVSLIERGGSRFLAISIGSGWRAHPLNEDIEDRFYVLKSTAVRGKPSGYGREVTLAGIGTGIYKPIEESDLVKVNGKLNPDSNPHGWYMELPNEGEKVLGKSVTFDNKVLFSTFLPKQNVEVCTPAIGTGRYYILDVATGRPAVDLNGDGKVDINDIGKALKHEGIPPEPAILITESGKPIAVIGPEKLEADIDNTTRRTFWSDKGRLSTKPDVTAENEEE